MGHKLIRDEQHLTERERLITADAAEAAVATVAFLLEEKVRRQGRRRLVSMGVSETLCMRLSPCGFDGSFVEPFWV